MNNKQLTMMAIGLIGTVMMSACGENKQTEQSTAQSAQSTTAIAVGVDTTYPPYALLDERGNVIGFEPEILQAIAQDQGLLMQFVSAPRSTLYPDLQAGKYQILAASLNINPERQAQSELSEPYAKSHRVILSRSNVAVNSYADLQKMPSSIVAVQEGTNSLKLLEELKINNRSKPSLFTAFKSVMTSEVDYVVGDKIPLEYYLNQHNKKNEAFTLAPFNPEEGDSVVVFAINKGNTDLLNKINTGLNNIKSSGKYNQIYDKWFKTPDASINIK